MLLCTHMTSHYAYNMTCSACFAHVVIKCVWTVGISADYGTHTETPGTVKRRMQYAGLAEDSHLSKLHNVSMLDVLKLPFFASPHSRCDFPSRSENALVGNQWHTSKHPQPPLPSPFPILPKVCQDVRCANVAKWDDLSRDWTAAALWLFRLMWGGKPTT
jgi:hypothetical protein